MKMPNKKIVIFIFLIGLAVTLLFGFQFRRASAWTGSDSPLEFARFGPDFSHVWGTVKDVDVDLGNGNVYIITENPWRIVKMSSDGTIIKSWVSSNGFRALALDSAENVYAITNNGSQISKYDSDGNFITVWSTYSATGIATDTADNVYSVTPNGVEKFTSAGATVTSWGSNGSGNGQFSSPQRIAIDSSNFVYVTDSGNNRVQKFTSSGTYVSQFGTLGTGDGQFTKNSGIEIDNTGNIFVADLNGTRVQKFNSAGQFSTSWIVSPLSLTAEPPIYTTALGSDGSGNIYVGFERNVINDGITLKKYSTAGTFIENISQSSIGDTVFQYPFRVMINSNSDVFITDLDANQVQKFDSDGNYVTRWGSSGTGDGQFSGMTGIAEDSVGNIYVVDDGDRVQKFNSAGVYLLQWGSTGAGNGEFSDPWGGIAIDTNDNVYVLDSGNDRVQKFNTSGVYQTQWGLSGSGNGEFSYPEGIATDSAGNVYVADSGNNRVQKFDSSGNYITQWGVYGTADGEFDYVTGISVDDFGNVFVSDVQWLVGSRIQIFNTSGTFLNKVGTYGANQTDLYYAEGVANDAQGNLFVIDGKLKKMLKYTFDRLPASVSVTPLAGDATDDTTPDITGSAVDALTAVTAVEVSVDAGSYSACTAIDGAFDELSEAYTCSIASPLGGGSHEVLIRSTDSLTNTNTGGNIASYTFTVTGVTPTPTPTPTDTPTPTPTVTAPTVTSGASSNVDETVATVTGTVTSDGGSAVTERGIVYSFTNTTPTTSDSKQTTTGTTGAMSVNLSGLTRVKTYYARAYATNAQGTSYGSVITFKTLWPLTLRRVYFTFGKLRYDKYAAPTTLRTGDTAYLKNYNTSQLKLLQVFLYDYAKNGNQAFTKSRVTTSSMYLRTNYILPTGKRYAYVMKFQDKATGIIATKYFVVYTTKTWLGKSTL